MSSYSFSSDFVFGSATASYQIEGAAAEGGRTPSIWDTFSHAPGNVENGDNGDIACDHYHRWGEDIALMRELGIDAYRLSISWSRVRIDGTGAPNQEGIAFYRTLLQELRESGIRPIVTLYHWDLPQPLQDLGGWTVRETAVEFAGYARLMAKELGNLVDTWTTLNEPWCSAYLGYASGVHAPGITDELSSLKAVHHLNLAHGLAVQAIREELGEDTKCSVTLNLHVVRPADANSSADVTVANRVKAVGNEVFLGPMMEGVLPELLLKTTKDITDWSFVQEGDLEAIHQRIDVLGVNYYSTSTVEPLREGEASSSGGHGDSEFSPWPGCADVKFLAPEGHLTEMGWNIDPAGLREVLLEMHDRYPETPLMVTENGAAFPDEPDADGVVHDTDRIDYVRRHLIAVTQARAAGADVRGYFLWSLLDNFEWSLGYGRRFGIIRVDYDSGRRTPKDSYRWYADVIRNRCVHSAR